jgi:hypothetical protein
MEPDFDRTLSFLYELGNCSAAESATGSCNKQFLLSSLMQTLALDGHSVQNGIVENVVHSRNLRGLMSEETGGVNWVDVSFVVMCIICAGFASGLTQVCKLFLLPKLCVFMLISEGSSRIVVSLFVNCVCFINCWDFDTGLVVS